VPWWTWIALGFFAVVLAAALVVGFVGVRRVGRLQESAEAMAASFEALAQRAEELERRAATVEERRAVMEEHFARLGRSRQRFAVLTWALRDATRELTSLRSVLRK
jgi:cell division protein FtsB